MTTKNKIPSISNTSFSDWLERLGEGFSEPEKNHLKYALDLVITNQLANPCIPIGIDVAVILKKLNVDAETITATLLTGLNLSENLNLEDITKQFGRNISVLVENANRLITFNDYSQDILDHPRQAEILRRMLLAMANDVRAVVIKLAYRIHRLRKMSVENAETQLHIAKETLNIYAPLANRMGIAQLKSELEDQALRYLHPEIYKNISQSLAENLTYRESYLEQFAAILRDKLHHENIAAEVYGRAKHIYSIWRKMQQKQLLFNELFDIRAIRITTEKISNCYEILGLIHGGWSYIPKEFDDYIANPKPNGYQSLHTVIVGPEDKLIEIQIRTQAMHEFAELGIAAHWRYKEGGKQDQAVENTIISIRKLLEKQSKDGSLLENFQTELYADRIFVLTPKGELKDLVKGATPLDFAYAIHTEIGHRCRGAKVDGRIVPLTYELHSGERVEILTTKIGEPNRSWINPSLGYLKSLHAINKVKAWFKKQNHEQNIQDGKAILEKTRQSLNLEKVDIDRLLNRFHLYRSEDFYIQLGRGDISLMQLTSALQVSAQSEKTIPVNQQQSTPVEYKDIVSVQGIGNILTHLSGCCNPVPGDLIIGYITQGKGIAIHQQNCSNLLNLSESQKDRLIDVNWGNEKEKFPAHILIQAYDRQNLLKDITQTLSLDKTHILELKTYNDKDTLTVIIELTIEVKNTEHLAGILSKISQLRNVFEASRQI